MSSCRTSHPFVAGVTPSPAVPETATDRTKASAQVAPRVLTTPKLSYRFFNGGDGSFCGGTQLFDSTCECGSQLISRYRQPVGNWRRHGLRLRFGGRRGISHAVILADRIVATMITSAWG
jgi:hypothetical protein